jgi:hypothetical protein
VIEKIGEFSAEVINALNLDIPVGTEIVLSIDSRSHIKESHPDVEQYIGMIAEIIASPDYIGYNSRKSTVDFIRADRVRLCVPVRPSSDGIYFVRSLFKLHKRYFERLKRKNAIIPIDKHG